MTLIPDGFAARCAADSEFTGAARYWSGTLALESDGDRVELVLVDGVPVATRTERATRAGPGHVGIVGTAEIWDRLLAPTPDPYHNDIMPAQAFGLRIEGDQETLWQYYPAIRRVIDLLRVARVERAGHHDPTGAEAPDRTPAGRPTPRFDSPVGRYVHLDLGGQDHRVYFEEAGTGLPLLLQHTAGSHGAQWRHLFEDPWVSGNFRLVAYDLPFHGKSLPPEGRAWWQETYRLTTEFAMSVPVALAGALGLDRPAFMGCSIGGSLALDLARWHPERFRAVIALEPSLKVDTDVGQLAGFWHPRVNSEFKAHVMYGLMAPQSPEPQKRETVFAYSQGWPPLFLGDLHYYLVDHDLREEGARIDTSKVAVHLLTGEYDYSATVVHGAAAHEAIAGSTFAVMPGLGHFPMCEDPERFLTHLRPVLESVLAL